MTSAPAPPDLPSEAIAHLHQGHVVEAIRIVRETHQLQLKEAKGRVDGYIKTQPALQQVLVKKRAEAKATLLHWLLIVGCLGALAYVAEKAL